MNRSQIFLLVAVLSLGSFYVWSKFDKLETDKRETESKRYFPEKKEEDIEAISVVCTDPNFEYTLRRNGDRWYIDGHLASHERSPQLVMSLIEMTTEKEILATPTAEDDKEFGFEHPTYTITVTANGGVDLGTVLLGKRAPTGNHFYGRWQKGGPIFTVPTYMFSVLEEEPKELRENSPFPVGVTAVKSFEFTTAKEKVKLARPEGQNDAFEIVEPEKLPADESKLNELMYRLKDLKVARFLAESEATDLGAALVSYRVHEAGSSVDVVTEFCQPVAVTPKLRYGRRYLAEPGKTEPRPGTQERFVIELPETDEVLSPTLSTFQDKRIEKLDVDKVKRITLLLSHDEKLTVERLPQGGWKVLEPKSRSEENDIGPKADKLLWALRDLRHVDSPTEVEPVEEGQWRVELDMSQGRDLNFGFGKDKSGKPYVGFRNKNLFLQESSVPALDDAALGLSGVSATPTPKPHSN